jgi:hypothetical protein
MIKIATLLVVVAACGVQTEASPPDETLEMAAACCTCDASPYDKPPGSISTGFLAVIPTDSSGGCDSYKGQAGNVGLGNHISYDSPGLHDCHSTPMPSGGCPNTFTPAAKAIQWPTDD